MSEMIIYEDGTISLEVSLEDNSIWLDANDIASIFDVKRPAIVKHISNIYKSEELEQESTCSILEQVAKDGKIVDDIICHMSSWNKAFLC